jgi:cathepsin L
MRFIIAIAVFLCLDVVHSSGEITEEFKNFKLKHGKVYKNAQEEAYRLQVFSNNKAQIAAHNELFQQGKSTFTMGLNQYSDMTYEEFSSIVLMPISHNITRRPAKYIECPSDYTLSGLPGTVDWRNKGFVTSVKDQGQCGSCYAFSSTGSLEGQHFKKTGKLVSLSEQNIVDCSWWYGNNGCGGGFLESSFEYVRDNRGIATEKSYPYTGYELNCHYDLAVEGAECSGYYSVASGNELALKYAVASAGPISACIYASNSFHQYSGGVFYGYDCPNSGTNHCILIVGYGNDNGKDYWLVKNSWGTGWGINGYIKMSRNQGNNCQIATDANYPIM